MLTIFSALWCLKSQRLFFSCVCVCVCVLHAPSVCATPPLQGLVRMSQLRSLIIIAGAVDDVDAPSSLPLNGSLSVSLSVCQSQAYERLLISYFFFFIYLFLLLIIVVVVVSHNSTELPAISCLVVCFNSTMTTRRVKVKKSKNSN